MYALTISDPGRSGLGKPIVATIPIAGCLVKVFSNLAENTLNPPTIIMSFVRSTIRI